MNSVKDELKNIPGTTVFDSTQSRIGYRLNMWCMTLRDQESRNEFKANERAYLKKHSLNAEECQAILARDYNQMIALGGNIYFLSKLAAVDGQSFQQIAANMCDVSVEEFQKMMRSGGRAPHAPLTSPKGKR